MRVNVKSALALAALGVSLSALPASAATICVAKTGCPNTTITAGIAAAANGDTLSIAAGTYLFEGTINVSKSVKLVGVGVVIIDNEIGTGYLAGPQLYVLANNVGLTNLTIRNGRSHGIQVNANVTGFSMTSVKVLGPDGDCVFLNGPNDGAKITLSTLRACNYGIANYNGDSNNLSITSNTFEFVREAIYSYGDGHLVLGNKIGPTESYGIELYGVGQKVQSNILYQTNSYGIYVDSGDGHSVLSNTVTNTAYSGISVDGDTSVITGNIITNPYGYGIEAYGANLQVKTNTIKSTYYSGIYVHTGGTSNTSNNAIVSGNKVTVNNPNYYGLEIYDGNNATVSANTFAIAYNGIYASGLDKPTITLNTMTNIQDAGMYLWCLDRHAPAYSGDTPCTGGNVLANKVTDNAYDDYGFYIDTDDGGTPTLPFTFSTNTAIHTGYDCFSLRGSLIDAKFNKGFDCGEADYAQAGMSLYGSNHTVTSNQIFRSSSDGFYVSADGTTLTTNVSDHAGEDGFDIFANNVTLNGNKANFGNGIGFETHAPFTGISFTGGNAALGNALGACFATGGSTSVSGLNSFGTPDTPFDCTELPAGYIGN